MYLAEQHAIFLIGIQERKSISEETKLKIVRYRFGWIGQALELWDYKTYLKDEDFDTILGIFVAIGHILTRIIGKLVSPSGHTG